MNSEWTTNEEAMLRSELGADGVEELERVLRDWQSFVETVESTYKLTIYDYDNDLDLRDTIERVMDSCPPVADKLRSEVTFWDERFRVATEVFPRRANDLRWWHRRVPLHPGPELGADLRVRST